MAAPNPDPRGTSAAPRPGTHGPRRRRSLLALLGPAFVVSVAYVDPGNIAANLTAGARHGYLLLWVLVLANLMAVLVQYLSAKLGAVTGRSLAQHLAGRLSRPARLAYWVQAELVSAATDIAEVIGGALALHILFGLPLLAGGLVVGLVSMAILMVQTRGERRFQAVVIGFLVIITVGFLGGLVVNPPDPVAMFAGLVPRFEGSATVLLATSMLGATVMPHAIYLHSGLVRDANRDHPRSPEGTARLLRATGWDVLASLLLAGTVNVAMLVLAATALRGVEGTDTIEGAHRAITTASGPVVGTLFAIGLLASGLASTSVGAHAGASIMADLVRLRVPLVVRRLLTLGPALVVLALGIDPTTALVLSQVVLSIGIPFALVPLVHLTGDRELLGRFANRWQTRVAAWLASGLIIVLNVALVVLLVTGA